MKKLTLIFILSFYAGLFTFATGQVINDTTKLQKDITLLDTEGGKVYNGIKLLKKQEVENYLAPYPEIFLKYKSGMKLKSAGTGLLIGGGALLIGGTALVLEGIDFNTDIEATTIIGFAGAIVGAIMIEGGLACTIIGNIKTVRSIKNYNEAINLTGLFSPEAIKYQLGLLDNGRIGVQLRF